MNKYIKKVKIFTNDIFEVIKDEFSFDKRHLVLYKKNLIKAVREIYESATFRKAYKIDGKIIRFVLVPMILALIFFVFVRPTLAQLSDQQTRLSQYLVNKNVEIGNENSNGFSRIFYIFEGKKIYISPENQNARQPNQKGEYVTYVVDENGAGQVFVYNLISGSMVQITHAGTNLSPVVSREGVVVWEGWIDEGWQLFVYDGKRAYQLTQGETSKNADIEGNFIVFARKSISGLWHSVAYSLKDQKFEDISVSEDSEYPKVEADGTIYYGPPFAQQKKYPLKVQDLFIFNLAPLSNEQNGSNLTVDDILKQLDQAEISSSGSAQVQNASSSGQLGN